MIPLFSNFLNILPKEKRDLDQRSSPNVGERYISIESGLKAQDPVALRECPDDPRIAEEKQANGLSPQCSPSVPRTNGALLALYSMLAIKKPRVFGEDIDFFHEWPLSAGSDWAQ
jgi:hypothetical protein